MFNCTDGKPDLIILEKYPHPSGNINIMEEVVPECRRLGNILLKSPNGVRVSNIEMNNPHNVKDVVYDIFKTWLSEDADATWSNLVKCLKDANLNSLAKDIERCLV